MTLSPTQHPILSRSGRRALMCLALLLVAPPALAEPFARDLFAPGDGLVTHDPSTGLEWLDPVETENLSWNDVVGGAGGWTAAGWRHATGSELCALIVEMGIPLGGPCPGPNTSPAPWSDPLWWDLIGKTMDNGCEWVTHAMYDDGDPASVSVLWNQWTPQCIANASFPDFFENSVAPTSASAFIGHMLVRTACSDGVDQDGDGLIDLADPDCSDSGDQAEWSLSSGDLLVADEHLYRVDPGTGATTILVPLAQATGVAVGSDGNVYYGSSVEDRVYRLDADSGTLSIVSSALDGSHDGPLASSADGQILFERGTDLVSFDVTTETTTVLRSFSAVDAIAVAPSGSLLFYSLSSDLIRQVNLVGATTGNLTDALGLQIGAMDVAPDGSLLVSSLATQEVYRVPLPYGQQGALSQQSSGLAPAGASVLAVEADGSWLTAADAPAKEIHRFPGGAGPPVLLASGGPIDDPKQFSLVRPPHDGPQCANGIDDDHDGQTDLADADCADAQEGSEWALAPDDLLAIGNGTLGRVDGASGEVTVLAPYLQAAGVALGNDAALYVIENIGVLFDRIVRLALGDGAVTEVGPTSEASPMALNAAGTMFYGGGDKLFAVDPVTGDETVVTQAGALTGVADIVVEPSGLLIVASDDKLVRVDPANGQETVIWSVPSSGSILGMDFDTNGDLILVTWRILEDPKVWRMDLPGAGAPVELATSLGSVFGPIAVEPDNSFLIADDAGVFRFPGGADPPSLVLATRDPLGLLAQVEPPQGLPGPPECSNGLDDDGDGLVDHPDDPGCFKATSTKEAPQCSDGVDNDADGDVDLADAQCNSAADDREAPNPSCGLGAELAVLLPLLRLVRRRAGGRGAPRERS